jgi:hypothetical protein
MVLKTCGFLQKKNGKKKKKLLRLQNAADDLDLIFISRNFGTRLTGIASLE